VIVGAFVWYVHRMSQKSQLRRRGESNEGLGLMDCIPQQRQRVLSSVSDIQDRRREGGRGLAARDSAGPGGVHDEDEEML